MKIILNEDDNIESKEIASAYKRLFLNNKDGRIILDDLSRKANILQATNSKDTSQLLYIEGMRSIFYYIVSHLENQNLYNNTQVEDYNPFSK